MGLMDSPNLGDILIADCLTHVLKQRGCAVTLLDIAAKNNSVLTRVGAESRVRLPKYKLIIQKLSNKLPSSLIAYTAWRRSKALLHK
ncbi:hypothetical protein, partial [Cereibacter changlensis]|uniref:hypothetical protein n=1 Tax=Cereibacter changlensis TaxID=402884 RepID=UPI001C62E297